MISNTNGPVERVVGQRTMLTNIATSDRDDGHGHPPARVADRAGVDGARPRPAVGAVTGVELAQSG